MNTTVRMLTTILLILPFLNSFAQTTVTLENFMSVFTPGSYHYYTGNSGNYNIGQFAGPQVFDYSNVDLQNLNISNNYLISSIPILAERFPQDGITIGETPTTIEKNPVFLVKGDSVFNVGQASLVPEYRFSHYAPYELLGKFPVTYGSSFSQFITYYDTTYNSNWQIISAYVSSSTEIITIDAYGTLRLQSGDYECLRMKRDHTGYGDKEFIFITREGIFLDVLSASYADTGLVAGDFFILLPSTFVSVDNERIPVTEFNLEQNYPNPFNPSTRISWQSPVSSWQTLKVYDLLGREVATLVDEYKNAGTYNVEFGIDNLELSSGIYFYQLKAGEYLVTKKMMFLK
jgi:hypothetical protein